MAQGDQHVGFRAEPGFVESIDDYADEYGKDDRSQAMRELVEVGLREQRSPILWRAKERVVEWVNWLAITAILIFALGTSTTLVTFQDGVIAALFMLALASALLAMFGMFRLLAGANGLGVEVRQAIAVVVGRE